MIASLAKAGVKLRVLVSITNATDTFQFISGPHPSITVSPIVKRLSTAGAELDIKTRKISYGTLSVEFIDNGEVRDIIATEFTYNQKLTIQVGTTLDVEAAFTTIFVGRIKDHQAIEGGVRIDAEDLRSQLKDSSLRARDFVSSDNDFIVNRHPLQILLAIVQQVFPAGQINTASFDPDLYDSGPRANSHWNTARAVHGSYDRRVTEPESAIGMMDDLAMLLGGALRIDLDGIIEFKLFDPTEAVVADFLTTDIKSFKQVSSTEDTHEKFSFFWGWKGKSSDNILVEVPSGRARSVPSVGEYLHHINRVDGDAVVDHAFPGTGLHADDLQLTSKWLGVNGVLEAEIGPTATTFSVIGGWVSSFSGVERFLNGVSDGAVNFGLNGTDRKGLVSIRGFDFNLATMQFVFGEEVIEVDSATVDFISTGGPSTDGDSDLVGIPMRVTFTVAGGVAGRGKFGTVPSTLTRNSLVTDLTIPAQVCKEGIKRHSNGLPVSEIGVGAEFLDTLVADLVSLENDVFLAKGENGLTGVEKFEVSGVDIDTENEDPVTLRIVPAEDPTLVNIDDIWDRLRDLGREGFDDIFGNPTDEEEAAAFDPGILGGFGIQDPTGLNVLMQGAKIAGSPSWRVTAPPNIALVATRDNYLIFDAHSKLIIRTDTAIGAGAPVIHHAQQFLWKIETDGSGQVSREDLRKFQSLTMAPRIMSGANFGFANAAFGSQRRLSDRFPPDFMELGDLTDWGVGNDVEPGSGTTSSGDKLVQINAASLVIHRFKSHLLEIELGRPYQAEATWRTPAGGAAVFEVLFFKADKTPSATPSQTVFSKAPTAAGVMQDDRLAFTPPTDARFIQAVFRSDGLNSQPITVDRMWVAPTPISFHVFQTVSQMFANGALTLINYGTAEHDYGGNTSLAGALSRFICPIDSRYKFNGRIQFVDAAPNNTERVTLHLVVNAVSRKRHVNLAQGQREPGCLLETPPLLLTRGDIVELHAAHFLGGTRDTVVDELDAWFGGWEYRL